MNKHIILNILSTDINNAVNLFRIPSSLKIANVTPVSNKGNQLKKNNYRPVSICQIWIKSLKDA